MARPRGTGSLYIRKDSAGRETWYGRVFIRREDKHRKKALGLKRQPGSASGLTRSQAERALRAFADECESAPTIVERMTVESAGERYLGHLEALGRKRSTMEGYWSAQRVHLSPFFAGRSLETITPSDVEAFIAAKRREGKATKSILNFVGLLYSIFEYACSSKRGWAAANPVKDAEMPTPDPSGGDIRFLEMPEIEALLRAVPDDVLGPVERVLYLVAVMAGLRQGELLALRWRDIDWPAGKIRVRQNWVRGEVGTPKSRRGSRAVPLADRAAAELERRFQASAFQGDDDLVFPHPQTGAHLDRSKLLKRFKAALRRAGVREVRFHDLRHTFGTRMAAQGVPMRTLQEWMGHRDARTTQIYADYAPSAHERAWVEAAFGGSDRGAELSETQMTSANGNPVHERERTRPDVAR